MQSPVQEPSEGLRNIQRSVSATHEERGEGAADRARCELSWTPTESGLVTESVENFQRFSAAIGGTPRSKAAVEDAARLLFGQGYKSVSQLAAIRDESEMCIVWRQGGQNRPSESRLAAIEIAEAAAELRASALRHNFGDFRPRALALEDGNLGADNRSEPGRVRSRSRGRDHVKQIAKYIGRQKDRDKRFRDCDRSDSESSRGEVAVGQVGRVSMLFIYLLGSGTFLGRSGSGP